jgi:heme exporter protein B
VLRSAALVAGKDLRIEARSRVTTNQVLPFALVVLLLFAFALDPDRGILRAATPGLFWVAVLLALVVAVQRTYAIEADDGGADGLRLAGLEPAGIFLGKAGALAVELVVLEVVLGAGIVLLYDAEFRAGGTALLAITMLMATIGLAATGTLVGALTVGGGARETLLPLLLLPIVTPVLIGATRATESALGERALSEGWPWIGLLAVFALAYTAAGLLAYGPLLEDA